MTKITIRFATELDAKRFKMCEEDKVELLQTTGRSPGMAIRRAFNLSRLCYAVLHDGVLVGLCGIGPKECPSVWLLRTTEYPRVTPREYLLVSKVILANLTEGVDHCGNVLPVTNTRTRRWLIKLGFTFSGAISTSQTGHQVEYFYKMGDTPCVT